MYKIVEVEVKEYGETVHIFPKGTRILEGVIQEDRGFTVKALIKKGEEEVEEKVILLVGEREDIKKEGVENMQYIGWGYKKNTWLVKHIFVK